MNSYMGIKEKKEKGSRGGSRGNGSSSSKMARSGSMVMGAPSVGGYALMHSSNDGGSSQPPLSTALSTNSQNHSQSVAIYNYDALGAIVEPPPTIARLGGVVNNKSLPMTDEAAAQKFGLSTFTAQDNFKLLEAWKIEGDIGHQHHKQRVQYEADMKRIADKKMFDERCKYVNDRVRDIQRREMREMRNKE